MYALARPTPCAFVNDVLIKTSDRLLSRRVCRMSRRFCCRGQGEVSGSGAGYRMARVLRDNTC